MDRAASLAASSAEVCPGPVNYCAMAMVAARLGVYGLTDQPFGGYFQPAADAVAREVIVDRATELVGDEVADHRRAVAGASGRVDLRAAGLPPLKHQFATGAAACRPPPRSEEHTSELQSRPHLVCRLLLEKKKKI